MMENPLELRNSGGFFRYQGDPNKRTWVGGIPKCSRNAREKVKGLEYPTAYAVSLTLAPAAKRVYASLSLKERIKAARC